MRFQHQTILDAKDGDCINACIATITELPIEEIPTGKGECDGYYPALLKYLKLHGWLYLECTMDFYFVYYALQEIPVIVSVPSQMFEGKTHAVVACVRNGSWQLLHDPNPKNKPYDLSKHKIREYSLVLRPSGLPSISGGDPK